MIDWLWWAIDLLASEYGGGVWAIMQGVYLDEAIRLIQKITRRRLDGYKIQSAIASFPWMEKDAKAQFIKNLESDPFNKKENKLDTAGIEALKFAMSQNPRIIVK